MLAFSKLVPIARELDEEGINAVSKNGDTKHYCLITHKVR